MCKLSFNFKTSAFLYAYNFILLANEGKRKCFKISRDTQLTNDAAISYGFVFQPRLRLHCGYAYKCVIYAKIAVIMVHEKYTKKEIMPYFG